MPEGDSEQHHVVILWEAAIEVPRALVDSEPRWKEIIEEELRSTAKSKSGAVAITLVKMTIDDARPDHDILVVAIYRVAIPVKP